jgi:Fur family transcriptional regulator, ferric uptake regulator
MEQYWAQYIEILKQNGMSITGPRREVFMALYSFGLQTMTQLIARCTNSDRASVYRVVGALESIGVVSRISTGFRYKLELSDTFLPHHHHISCIHCGKNREIEQSRLEHLLAEIAENEDFTLTGHQVELSGLCRTCRKPS